MNKVKVYVLTIFDQDYPEESWSIEGVFSSYDKAQKAWMKLNEQNPERFWERITDWNVDLD